MFVHSFLFFTILSNLSFLSSELHFDQGTAMIPHPSKEDTGGEDAFYSDNKLIVVADGVGGWRSKGVDSGVFSRRLCQNAQKIYKSNQQLYNLNPKQLIVDSQQHNHELGSSTMLVLTLSKNSLKTSYIGDSRYIIIRKKELIFEAAQQQHSFNFPYQLASRGSKFGFNPNRSLHFSHSVRTNDILVVGSDGLFDNIFIKQIIQIIYKKGQFQDNKIRNKRALAQHLCEKAISYGKQLKYTSPFAINAYKNKKLWQGGKLDDTTVVIAQIQIDQQQQQNDSSSSEQTNSQTSSESQSSTSKKQTAFQDQL